MSVRVNLLNQDEVRYYTAVSRAFAVRTGAIGLLLLLTLVGILFILRVSNIKSGLENNQAEWAALEPRLEKYQNLKENYKSNEGLMTEIKQWKQMKNSWDGPLFRFQTLLPDTLQFTSMDLKSSFGARIDRTKIGKGDEAREIVNVVPSRTYRMILQGIAEGELADETVVQFVKTIRADSAMSSLWESVKLQSLQKKQGASDTIRVFTLEAVSAMLEAQ